MSKKEKKILIWEGGCVCYNISQVNSNWISQGMVFLKIINGHLKFLFLGPIKEISRLQSCDGVEMSWSINMNGLDVWCVAPHESI